MQNAVLKILVLLAVLLNTDDKTFAQKPPENKIKRNNIEAYIPIIHFFDDHKTNWTYTFPISYGPSPRYPHGYKGFTRPSIYSFSYNRFNKKKLSGFSASFLYYHINWGSSDKFLRKKGEVYQRLFQMYSIGYQHYLLDTYGIQFWGIGNILLRKGGENFFINGHWDGFRELFDPGISAGIRATKFLPLNLALTFESYFTQVLYRVDQGFTGKKPTHYDFNQGSARNMLHLNYKLGYRF